MCQGSQCSLNFKGWVNDFVDLLDLSEIRYRGLSSLEVTSGRRGLLSMEVLFVYNRHYLYNFVIYVLYSVKVGLLIRRYR